MVEKYSQQLLWEKKTHILWLTVLSFVAYRNKHFLMIHRFLHFEDLVAVILYAVLAARHLSKFVGSPTPQVGWTLCLFFSAQCSDGWTLCFPKPWHVFIELLILSTLSFSLTCSQFFLSSAQAFTFRGWVCYGHYPRKNISLGILLPTLQFRASSLPSQDLISLRHQVAIRIILTPQCFFTVINAMIDIHGRFSANFSSVFHIILARISGNL